MTTGRGYVTMIRGCTTDGIGLEQANDLAKTHRNNISRSTSRSKTLPTEERTSR